jgi:lipid A 3-O-deacylase
MQPHRIGRIGGRLVVPVLLALAILAGGPAAPSAAESGFINEIKLGALAHDIALFGPHVESGVDINAEILFAPLPFGDPTAFRFPDFLLTPRPHIGASISTSGQTSIGYFGLTWTAGYAHNIFRDGDGIFGSFGFGGAVQNGDLNEDHSGQKALGSRVLFHLSAELGYRFTPEASIAAYYEHVSNAGLASPNPGMNNLGVRLGYRF